MIVIVNDGLIYQIYTFWKDSVLFIQELEYNNILFRTYVIFRSSLYLQNIIRYFGKFTM